MNAKVDTIVDGWPNPTPLQYTGREPGDYWLAECWSEVMDPLTSPPELKDDIAIRVAVGSITDKTIVYWDKYLCKVRTQKRYRWVRLYKTLPDCVQDMSRLAWETADRLNREALKMRARSRKIGDVSISRKKKRSKKPLNY